MTKKEVRTTIEEKIADRLEFARMNWNTWLQLPEETEEEKATADVYNRWAEEDKVRGYELIDLLEAFGFIGAEEALKRKSEFYSQMIA